ncbi:uncharacterized protein LOC134212641 [Armigeres subalbatus]|uniref:uncharacterized protein LOC134212641 n=1 Tax=Armigeres subalbatus TaxID=124917 RepID=UPI002ED4674C
MDRSVDSIGSCSLDVDADSTDFSDTSGELNFLTPNSAKDIQREFTAGIKERCKIPVINCQAVTTVLDPLTGNISTVLTTTSPQAETATTPVASKKPSYLNLACCVNGYSNLTTYDSKLRQDINKSREVSPNRPIIATLHYNRSEGGNFQLTAPTLSYISMNNTINNNINSGGKFGGMVNGSGRYVGGGGGGAATGQDVTDNAVFNGNGFSGGGLRTKVISSQSQISSVKETEKVVKKSFIQQRVEKLYGNAEGVVINKQIYNSNERKYLNNIANENVSKNYANALHMNGIGSVATNGATHGVGPGGGGGGGCALGFGSGTKENLDENNKEIADDPDMEALPVLRHLRPEFRAQLQIFSPKKVPKTSPSRSIAVAGNGTVNGTNNNHIISNGDLSHHHHHSHFANGKVTSNGTITSLSSASSLLSSSSSSSALESKREQHTTVTTTKTTTIKSSVACSESRSEPTLSVVTPSKPVTSGVTSDATVAPLYDNRRTTLESRLPITTKSGTTKSVPVAIEQASVEQQPSGVEQKMIIAEPTTMAVNGGDVGDCVVGMVTRSAASRKNGHHHYPIENKENVNGTDPVVEVMPAKTQVKDGNYFLQVLKNEQNRLLTMAANIERDVDQLKADGVEISEEVAGYVLVAAGKARLLCSQKMKQFEGLCYKNLNQSPEEKFQTTCEDLRGFWDMVMLQVNDVDASFSEIDSFRRNGWKKPAPKSPTPQVRSTARSTKLTKRPFKSPATASTTNGSSNQADGSSAADAKKAAAAAAAAKREAQRKQLMELKRKQKLANSQQNVEIFVPGAVANGTSSAVNTAAADTNGASVPPLVDAS